MNAITDNRALRSRARGWVKLAALAVLFTAPILVAFWWTPTGFVNHGELVTPARPLPDLEFATLDGAPLSFSALKRKWTLMYIGMPACGEVCKNNLYKINQVRLAQSKNAYRVQSVFVMPETLPERAADAVLTSYPGIIALRANARTMAVLKREFTHQQTQPPEARRVYVVDPLGNLMMSYPADADPTGMRKDLKRLLKVSQIG